MKQRRIHLILALLPLMLQSFGQTITEGNDSIKDVMLQEDYIKVSLMVASPGREMYSAIGHAALRMECPSRSIDYCYEYIAEISANNLMDFLNNKMEADIERHYTDSFLSLYKKEGRGVQEIVLNLNPMEEVMLWSILDKQVDEGEKGTFDCMDNSCVGCVQFFVNNCLGEERIVAYNVDEHLSGSFRDTFPLAFADSPWTGLFWNFILGSSFDTRSIFRLNLYPEALLDVWSKARIVGSNGLERPLAKVTPLTIVTPKRQNSPVLIEPIMLFAVLLLISILTFIADRKGWMKPGKLMDIFLMVTVTVIGIPMLFCWNLLTVVFSPVPLLLWLLLHKVVHKRWLYLTFIVVPVVYCLLTPLIPQMQYGGLQVLMLSFAIRSYSNYNNHI